MNKLTKSQIAKKAAYEREGCELREPTWVIGSVLYDVYFGGVYMYCLCISKRGAIMTYGKDSAIGAR
jgi:hypothetical protein